MAPWWVWFIEVMVCTLIGVLAIALRDTDNHEHRECWATPSSSITIEEKINCLYDLQRRLEEGATLTLSGLPAVVSTTMPVVSSSSVAVAEPPVVEEVFDPYLLLVGVEPGQYGSDKWGRCTQYEPLLEALAPEGGWSVDVFSRLMWRESRCDPTARSRTRDSGLLQINDRHLASLGAQWGTEVDPYDPVMNIRAAAVLCDESREAGRACGRPWGSEYE